MTLLFTFVVLDAGALLGDEGTYLLAARVFETAGMSLPAPAVPEAFEMYMVGSRGRDPTRRRLPRMAGRPV